MRWGGGGGGGGRGVRNPHRELALCTFASTLLGIVVKNFNAYFKLKFVPDLLT